MVSLSKEVVKELAKLRVTKLINDAKREKKPAEEEERHQERQGAGGAQMNARLADDRVHVNEQDPCPLRDPRQQQPHAGNDHEAGHRAFAPAGSEVAGQLGDVDSVERGHQ